MRYHVPDLYLATELPPQTALQDKLGGLPWGFPARLWPVCKDCGAPQALLAQLAHHAERLDLGREGRVLHVFQCNQNTGSCETWDGGSGANACLVVEPEEMSDGACAAPGDGWTPEKEARVQAWVSKDDAITPEQVPLFFSEDSYFDLPIEISDAVATGTRLGSVPLWVQSPEDAPSGQQGWRFVAQLDSLYCFWRTPGTNIQGMEQNPGRVGRPSHSCFGPDFGDLGTGYVFLRDAGDGKVPQGRFFWQCT